MPKSIVTPHPVDLHVGNRVRIRRRALNLSQEVLGGEVGVGFQQIQRYERGEIRIGASRLYALSEVLDVPVSFFYDNMPPEIGQASSNITRYVDPLATGEINELLNYLGCLEDTSVRKSLINLLRAIAQPVQSS